MSGDNIGRIIQLPDEPSSELSQIACYGFGDVDLSAGQFVIMECAKSGRDYLAQVVSAQANMNRDALSPFDNTSINQLEAVNQNRYRREVAVKEVFLYRLLLIKDVSPEGDGRRVPKSVRKRPQIAALGRAATEPEAIAYLGLPPAREETKIGTIIDTNISISVDQRCLLHHILAAGSTGSGKSNTIGNIVRSAINLGFAVIIYDHKPDYQNVHEPNDEGSHPHFRGMQDVLYWRLGEGRGNAKEREIVVRASDLNTSVLASTICYMPQEANSAETLDTMFEKFSMERGDAPWSMRDFKSQVMSKTAEEIENTYGVTVDKRTLGAMKNRLDRVARIPAWIDGKVSAASREFFGSTGFDVAKVLRPGRANVIRVDSSAGNSRGYGLFLSYMLKEVYSLRESSKIAFPVLHVIDEAQDIFCGSGALQSAIGGMLDDNIRKGRSRQIGFVIGVQSADAVPEQVRNNLNSRLIHRHNNHQQAREAMTRASPEQLAMTDTFGPGECLTYIFGSNAVVHAQMRQSPFKLTKG